MILTNRLGIALGTEKLQGVLRGAASLPSIERENEATVPHRAWQTCHFVEKEAASALRVPITYSGSPRREMKRRQGADVFPSSNHPHPFPSFMLGASLHCLLKC